MDVGSVAAPPDLVAAALWRRLLARGLDVFTVFFLLWMLVVVRVFWFVDGLADRFHPDPWGRALVPLVLFVVMSAVYEVVFVHWNNGQTPGKQHFGVRAGTGPDAAVPSVRRSIARWVLPGLIVLAWPLWVAAVLLCGTAITVPLARGRRSVHDLIAGTRVVRYDHVEDRADDDSDDDEVVEPEEPPSMTDLLLGKPIRRALRKPRGVK
jgi:uncharacterized RDD family membrane protein YckC